MLVAGSACAAVWGAAVFLLLSTRSKRPEFPRIDEAISRAQPGVAEAIQEIRAVLQDLAEAYPDSPPTLEVLARIHFRLDMPDEAVAYCHRALELDPQFGMAYYWLGVMARQKGNHREAADDFRKAIDLKTNSAGLVVDLADALLKAGRAEEAIPLVQEDLRVHPGSVASMIVLGEVYAKCKRFREARTTLEGAVRAAPDYTRAYLALATSCAQLGDTAKSKEYLQRFKELKDRDERSHRESLKAMDTLADLRLDVAQARLSAARVYLWHGDLKAAEDHLLRACELAPKEWESRQVLASLYGHQGRTEDSLRVLKDFAAVVPDDPKVMMLLGSLLGRMGRFDDAVASFRKAIASAPGQAMGYAALADLFLHEPSPKYLAEAKTLAGKAVDLQPTTQSLFLLALACRRSGDLTGARVALDRALALEPENEQLRRARDSLQPDDGGVMLPPLPK